MASDPATSGSPGKLGLFPFIVAGMSFIQMIGILFGAAAIVWGMLSKKVGRRKLVALGACGIAFTVIIYSLLFYFGVVQRGGVYDHLRTTMAQSSLNSAVPLIEYYKTTHGEYPATLDAVTQALPKDSFARMSLVDPRIIPGKAKQYYFYYRRIDPSHYYLRGVAPDGKPFSPRSFGPASGAGCHACWLVIAPPSDPLSDNP